jgi:DNA uptake protein ComE-like DNA-binding protein
MNRAGFAGVRPCASQEDLAKVSDIGPERARKILEYRNQTGKFYSGDELEQVPGSAHTLTEDLGGTLIV